jgi:hypothetical protein
MTFIARALSLPILVYRTGISPFIPARCRFEPSCSAYALEALACYGAFKGMLLALRRVLRCHPWGGYGYDPVPGLPENEAGQGSDKHQQGHCTCNARKFVAQGGDAKC